MSRKQRAPDNRALAAAQALIGTPCACGRPTTQAQGSMVMRLREYRSATVSCGDPRCSAYLFFGGPGGDFSVAPVPPTFELVGERHPRKLFRVDRAQGGAVTRTELEAS